MTISVASDKWQEELETAVRDGFDFPGFFAGADRGTVIELTAQLYDQTWSVRCITTTLPAAEPQVASIGSVIPGFRWNEREISEMLGVVFVGGDTRPLLRRDLTGAPLMLLSTPLEARLHTPWPGAAEPALLEGERGMQRRSGNPSRRRQRPPGIPDAWQVSGE